MSITAEWGVRVCRQVLLWVGCFCLCGPSQASAQGLRLSDADVSLKSVEAVVGVGSSGVGGQQSSQFGGVRRGKVAGDRLKRTGSRRSADQILIEEAVYKEAARYNIDPDLVLALIWQESDFRLNAVSGKNARGPFQLIPATAARFGVRNPHDAKEAARGGVAYLVWLLDRFKGNVSLALAGYNAGEAAVEAYLEGKTIVLSDGRVINPRGIRTGGIPPYTETVNYVRRIAERYRLLRAARGANVVTG